MTSYTADGTRPHTGGLDQVLWSNPSLSELNPFAGS